MWENMDDTAGEEGYVSEPVVCVWAIQLDVVKRYELSGFGQ